MPAQLWLPISSFSRLLEKQEAFSAPGGMEATPFLALVCVRARALFLQYIGFEMVVSMLLPYMYMYVHTCDYV